MSAERQYIIGLKENQCIITIMLFYYLFCVNTIDIHAREQINQRYIYL